MDKTAKAVIDFLRGFWWRPIAPAEKECLDRAMAAFHEKYQARSRAEELYDHEFGKCIRFALMAVEQAVRNVDLSPGPHSYGERVLIALEEKAERDFCSRHVDHAGLGTLSIRDFIRDVRFFLETGQH